MRICYPVRKSLVPIFGPQFPDMCFNPNSLGLPNLIPSYKKSLVKKQGGHFKFTSSSQGIPASKTSSSRSYTKHIFIPPPIPMKIYLPEETNIETDLLSLLQAARVLQQISVGKCFSSSDLGGQFECNGQRFSVSIVVCINFSGMDMPYYLRCLHCNLRVLKFSQVS